MKKHFLYLITFLLFSNFSVSYSQEYMDKEYLLNVLEATSITKDSVNELQEYYNSGEPNFATLEIFELESLAKNDRLIEEIMRGKNKNLQILESVIENNTQQLNSYSFISQLANADIIFIGEHHYDKLLNKIKYELDIKIANTYDIIFATEFIQQPAQHAINTYQELKKSFSGDIPYEKLQELEIYKKNAFNPSDNIVRELIQKDIEIVALDNVINYEEAASSSGIERRNQEWINVLIKILKDNPDKKILVNCGAAHSNYNELTTKPVSLRMEDLGYRVENINFVGGIYRYIDISPLAKTYRRLGYEKSFVLTEVPKEYSGLIGSDYIIHLPQGYSKFLIEKLYQTEEEDDLAISKSTGARKEPSMLSTD